jgi:hypothetical protein
MKYKKGHNACVRGGGRQSIAVYHMRAPLCGHDSTGCNPTGARASQPPVDDDQLKYFRDSSTRRVRQPIKNRPRLARLTRQPTTTHYKDRTAPSLVQFPPPPSNESWGRFRICSTALLCHSIGWSRTHAFAAGCSCCSELHPLSILVSSCPSKIYIYTRTHFLQINQGIRLTYCTG